MKQASEPFKFVTASYLIRIGSERAETLVALEQALRLCSEASIFYHTFQSLESHEYTFFSSDFSQWVTDACSEPELGEHLAALDLREFVSLVDLRTALVGCVEGYLRSHPASAGRRAAYPFYFCEAVELTAPRDEQASNLAELIEGIRRISLQTLHHHFINSRLRLRLRTNDFSYWVENSLEAPELAQRLNAIDFYVHTLEGTRQQIVETLEPWVER